MDRSTFDRTKRVLMRTTIVRTAMHCGLTDGAAHRWGHVDKMPAPNSRMGYRSNAGRCQVFRRYCPPATGRAHGLSRASGRLGWRENASARPGASTAGQTVVTVLPAPCLTALLALPCTVYRHAGAVHCATSITIGNSLLFGLTCCIIRAFFGAMPFRPGRFLPSFVPRSALLMLG